MKVDKEKLRAEIEEVIGNGIMTGEDAGETVEKIMFKIQSLINAVEYADHPF